MNKKQLLLTLSILAFTGIVAIDQTNTQQEVLPSPTEGSDEDGEDHAGREAFFNLIHTGNPEDNSWEKRVDDTRQQRADVRIRSRSYTRAGSLETYGAIVGKWIERGAKNQAGRVITTDVLESRDMVVLGTDGGSIMLGTLAGNSFEILNDEIKLSTISVHLFENGNDVRVVAMTSTGVYVTDNHGQNWTKTYTGAPVSSSYSRSSNKLYFHDNNGNIYTSIDNGSTFTGSSGTVSSNSKKARIWTARYANSPLFILSGTTVYAYENGSISTKGTVPATQTAVAATISGNDEWKTTTLFAAIDESNIDVFRSTNGGTSWTKQSSTPAAGLFHGNRRSFYSVNDSVLYVGDTECFRSTDRGVNWTLINTWGSYYGDPANKIHADIPEVRGYKNKAGNPLVLISSDGGTYVSYNNSTYKNITLTGIRNSQYYGTQTRWEKPDILLAGAQDQGIQYCGGGQADEIYDFIQWTSGDEGAFASSDSGKSSWFTYVYGSLYYNPNTLLSSAKDAGKPDDADSYMWICPTLADPQNPKICYVGGNYIHKVTYTGSTFTKAKQSQRNFGATLSALAISPVNRNHWYAATTTKKLFHSSDNGVTWTEINSAITNNNYLVGQDIIPDPKVLGKLYLCGNGTPAVLVSTDHGATFAPLGSNTPGGTTVYNMALSDDGNLLFAASTYAPFVFNFSENKWYDLGIGAAPDQQFYNVEYVPSIKTARFSTYGRGIWEFTMQDASTDPFVRVTSPNGGEFFAPTDTLAVRWSSFTDGDVTVDLFKKGVKVKTIGTLAVAAGKLLWPIDNSITNSRDYAIVISSVSHPTLRDTSDNRFAILDLKKLAQSHLSIDSVDSEEPGMGAANTLDGDISTIWHTDWSGSQPDFPHTIIYKVNTTADLAGFSYLGRNVGTNGWVDSFSIELSKDGIKWNSVAKGTLPNSGDEHFVLFDSTISGTFVKFTAYSEVGGSYYASMAEFNLFYQENGVVPLIYPQRVPLKLGLAGYSKTNVQLSIPVEGSYKIELFTLAGRKIFAEDRRFGAGINGISLKGIETGNQILLMRVTGEGNELKQKIMLQ